MPYFFVDGVEDGSLGQFTSFGGGAGVVSTAGLNMDGNYCINLSSVAASATLAISAKSELYVTMLWRPVGSNSGLVSFTDAGALIGRVRSDSSGFLSATVGTATVATSPISFFNNTTYFVEIYYKVADSGGRIVVKVEDIVVIDFTGDTKPSTQTGISGLIFGYTTLGTSVNGYSYLDNIILNDTGWIGRKKILGRAIEGAGSSTQWTPSSGSNWDCLKERPPNDTDFVTTNTVGHLDFYTLQDMPGSGIGNIHAVQVQARAIKEGVAIPQNLNLALRSGGANYFSGDKPVPTALATIPNIWHTDPATASAWTVSGINNLEVGQRAAT